MKKGDEKVRIKNDETIIMSGTIKKIHPHKSSQVFSFDIQEENSTMTVEFRNGKHNRADIARKMMLNYGEHVIIVGSMDRGSHSFIYGYDIKRDGMVSALPMVLAKGNVIKSQPCGNSTIIRLQYDGQKNLLIKVPVFLKNGHINVGDHMAFMCLRETAYKCQESCHKWSDETCMHCPKTTRTYKYSAMWAEHC